MSYIGVELQGGNKMWVCADHQSPENPPAIFIEGNGRDISQVLVMALKQDFDARIIRSTAGGLLPKNVRDNLSNSRHLYTDNAIQYNKFVEVAEKDLEGTLYSDEVRKRSSTLVMNSMGAPIVRIKTPERLKTPADLQAFVVNACAELATAFEKAAFKGEDGKEFPRKEVRARYQENAEAAVTQLFSVARNWAASVRTDGAAAAAHRQ